MSNFIITADTTMDLAPEVIAAKGIVPIASYVSMGEGSLSDYPDVSAKDLFDYVAKSGKLPQTAAATPSDYEDFFRKLRENDKRPIIHIAKSSGISSCYENAVLAAREVEDVYVVDSLALSGGSGLVVLKAADSTETDPKALCAILDAYKMRLDCSFIIETLDYLYKGGRCSGLAALGANILKLRPEIVVDKGYMHAGKKFRGPYEKCLITFIDDKFKEIERYDPEVLYVNHTIQDPAQLIRLLDHIRAKNYFKEIIEYPACAAIATHCGPNCFGLIPVLKEG